MRRLHEMTSETVSLRAQSDLHAQNVFQIPGVLPVPYPRLRQTVRPIERSGLGWLLMSAKSDEEIAHTLKRINYRSSRKQDRVELEELLIRVNEIRKNGFVFSKHTVVHGAGIIRMLIPPGHRDRATSH